MVKKRLAHIHVDLSTLSCSVGKQLSNKFSAVGIKSRGKNLGVKFYCQIHYSQFAKL